MDLAKVKSEALEGILYEISFSNYPSFSINRKQTEFHLLQMDLKPRTGQRITLQKYVTSMSCLPESVIQSCDTGQQILVVFWQLSIDHNMDVQYQVKHR